MACTSVLRSVLTTEPWMIPLHQNRTIIYYSLSSRKTVGVSTSKTPSIRAPEFHHFGRPRPTHANCFCSYNNNNNNEDDQDQDPPQEAVLKAISAYGHVLIETSVDDTEVSRTEGRVGQTTNVVIGGTVADDSTNEWLALDKKGRVRQKVSSRGKYVSVNIGPVQVVSSEQVQAVYNAMRRDDRMKYFL